MALEAMNVQIDGFRKASLWGLALSVPALIGVCSWVANFSFCFQMVAAAWVQLLVAFGAMIGFVWLSPKNCAAACARRLWLFGGYFVALFLWGVLAGALASMVLYQSLSFSDYVLKPLFWLSLYGVVPAFCLGLVAGFLMRRVAAGASGGGL